MLFSYSNYGGIPVKAEYCHEVVSLSLATLVHEVC